MKIQVTIGVIVHATEDITKIFHAFEDTLKLEEDNFTVSETLGHFGNPIRVLNAEIIKKQAQNFMKRLLEALSVEQTARLIEEIKERTVDSRFHMRLDKQELIRGNLIVSDGEDTTIKIKIHTPVYNKKETVKTFTEIFESTGFD